MFCLNRFNFISLQSIQMNKEHALYEKRNLIEFEHHEKLDF